MKLESLLQYMNEYLAIDGHADYPAALNGLQVAGRDNVDSVATAVDASLASIEAAVEVGAELLVVHHGLFWDGVQPLTGPRYRRIAALIEARLAVYSCHLPLDAHAEIGNCALLARAIGLELQGRVGAFKSVEVGWWGSFPEPVSAAQLVQRVSTAVGGPVHLIEGGPDRVERVGVLTGGGGSFVREAAELRLDAFVTGEGSHHTHFDATEFGIHVLFGGHYATETFGVRALGNHVADRFGVTVTHIDQPTGL